MPDVRRLLPQDAVTRNLAWGTLVNTFGNGLFFALSALFFTRVVGLSVAQVGLGLTIAGGCGVAAGVPAGRLADRFSPKHVAAICAGLEGLGLCLYPLVHSFAAFLVLVCAVETVDRGGSAVRNGLIAMALPPDRRATTRAYLRSITNVGIGLGAAVGAVALTVDTRSAYVTMVLLDAATFVITAAIMVRLPWRPATPAADGGEDRPPVTVRDALTDRPFLALTALNGVIAMQFAILEIGLPLWVVGHTQAPRIVVSAALLINTVLVVVLQVPATRNVHTPGNAARAGLHATALIAASCLLFGAASGVVASIAVTLIVVGVVVGALGEVLSSAAGWTLSYDLADQSAQGVYQGVFQTGFNLGAMLAPLVLTSTAIRLGFGGWALLGAIFVLAGAALTPATRWAERTRGRKEPAVTG